MWNQICLVELLLSNGLAQTRDCLGAVWSTVEAALQLTYRLLLPQAINYVIFLGGAIWTSVLRWWKTESLLLTTRRACIAIAGGKYFKLSVDKFVSNLNWMLWLQLVRNRILCKPKGSLPLTSAWNYLFILFRLQHNDLLLTLLWAGTIRYSGPSLSV